MNSDQIIKGFWYWDRENNWPPKALMHIEEFQTTEYLNLSITQTSLSSYEEKKLITAWCKILPTHKEVKYLWLSSRVTQEIFDAICEMSNLEGLYIKWSSVKTLDNLIKLKKLRHLHLGSSSKVESINVLGDMKSLISLELEQLNKVTDFAVISKLVHLKGLGITGSMWDFPKD